jgi:hypothetical protein
MRVWTPRYVKDLQRVNLARRLMEHGARSQVICDWTDLTIFQVRAMCRELGVTNGTGSPSRRRGPGPTSLTLLLSSERWRSEAAGLIGLCYVFEAMPTRPVRDPRRDLPDLIRGERFCRSYEVYHELCPGRSLDFDEALLVYTAVAMGDQIRADRCESCTALIIKDVNCNNRFNCARCAEGDDSEWAVTAG